MMIMSNIFIDGNQYNITSDYHNEGTRTENNKSNRGKNEKQRHIYMSRKYKDVNRENRITQ